MKCRRLTRPLTKLKPQTRPRRFSVRRCKKLVLTLIVPALFSMSIGNALLNEPAMTEYQTHTARPDVIRFSPTGMVRDSRIPDQQFQAGQFPASCRAPQSTCKKASLPLRRLESTTMPDSDRLRLSAQIVDLEQWCIPG